VQCPGRHDFATYGIDRHDGGRRRSDDRAPPADDIDEPAKARCRRVCGRRGQGPHPGHAAGGGVEREHARARGPVRPRAARDHDLAVDGGHGRIAQRRRQMADDNAWMARLPANDRVQPTGPGVAADDVLRVTDRGTRLVRTRSRQPTDGRMASGRDPDDSVELRNAVAAPEEIDGVAEPGCGRVMKRLRERRDGPAARPHELDPGRGHVGGRETSGEDHPAAPRCRCRVLDRRGQSAEAVLDQENGLQPAVRSHANITSRSRLRGGRRLCGLLAACATRRRGPGQQCKYERTQKQLHPARLGLPT
jgi:hypothetical protein